jgi:hypothetical protein
MLLPEHESCVKARPDVDVLSMKHRSQHSDVRSNDSLDDISDLFRHSASPVVWQDLICSLSLEQAVHGSH